MTWPALLDRRGFVLVLVAVWALAYLPNLGARTLRLEEGRRATPAREMIASGDFVRPTLYGETYLNKPPLFFWLVAAVGTVVGEVNPLATRLPSVLAALGCALVALRFAPDVLNRRTRSLAAVFVLATATLLDKGTLGEIDATLCFVVAAALKVWWDGNRSDRQTWRSWIAVGVFLGLAGLLKGPAGPVIFYLTVGPFLVGQRRATRLVSAGHLVCIFLMVLPSAAWVAALLDRGAVSISELTAVWGHQIGAHHVTGAVDDAAARRAHLLSHYCVFPLQLLGMLFPAILWLPFARLRCSAANDAARFVACGVLGPGLVFYLYPESRPRHLMPVFFSAAVLAAVVVSKLSGTAGRAGRITSRLSLLLNLVPVAIGFMSLALSAYAYPDGLPVAAVVLAVTGVWSWIAVRMTLHTPHHDSHWTLAMSLCGATLAAWFAMNAVVVPWRAPHSPIRVALQSTEGRLAQKRLSTRRERFPEMARATTTCSFIWRETLRCGRGTLMRLAPCVAVVTPAGTR